MPELEISISGDASVVDLDSTQLESSTISFYNNPLNPADILYLIAPESVKDLEWISRIRGDDPDLDLMIILAGNTHIHDGCFEDFNHVMITNHGALDRTDSGVFLKGTENGRDVRLIIENFRTSKGLVFCSHLALIAGGIAKDLLFLHLESPESQLKLEGKEDGEKFTVGKLQIHSDIKKLTMRNVLLRDDFSHQRVEDLVVEKTSSRGVFELSDVGNVRKFGLSSETYESSICCEKIEVSNLWTPKGKFYIAAKSYIDFKIARNGRLEGIDLVLDMSDGNTLARAVTFPAQKFSFEKVKVLGASRVAIPAGGYCKELTFENCEDVSVYHVMAQNISHKIHDRPSSLLLQSVEVLENFITSGKINMSLDNFKAPNLEAYGLCRLNLSGEILIKMIKFNLNLDMSNPEGDILAEESAIILDNLRGDKIEIDTILAKLSTFHIKGQAKFGTVLIVPIAKIATLFWIEMTGRNPVLLDRLFVGGKHDVVVQSNGSINIIRHENLLDGGPLFASVSQVTAKDHIYAHAGQGIRFDGTARVIEGEVGLFSASGDIIINGHVFAQNSVVLSAKQGEVITRGVNIEAKAIAIYSQDTSYLQDTTLKAQELVIYSLNSHISKSKIEACNIAIITTGDVCIDGSEMQAARVHVEAQGDVVMHDTDIITPSAFVQAIRDFVQINSGIRLVQHPHILFANEPSVDSSIIKGGVRVATDVDVVGLYDENGQTKLSTKLVWQQVKNIDSAALLEGTAYIEARRGFIIGSSLDASNSVIIKTRHSLEVVPLVLYNEVMEAGGFNEESVVEVISRINAGLINIEAGKTATFISSILKAATGSIDSDAILLLNNPKSIERQQQRVRELSEFVEVTLPENPKVGDYFNFHKATHIASSISNLGLDSDYASPELYFTQKRGDVVIDKSITKYSKLHVTAANGKILITSPDLQRIYQGSGAGNAGREATHERRTVVGGGEVHLVANEVTSEAGVLDVSGELKIVARDGVYLLPVSVHQSLMYHIGSKTTVTEREVRLVVSEINAGFLNIKAGGALKAVSTLIEATGVDLDVGELELLSEREIFERNVFFRGEEKFYGGRNTSTDRYLDGTVIPTLIKADRMNARVDGKTTMEAAQVLVKEESRLEAGGDVNILAKYDIHVHDRTQSKAYLLKFDDGKLIAAGTKTVREYFYGEAPVPTIYYNKGDFYGYSGGQLHLLGSKIIANNLHLVAKKGIKLEACAFHQEQIVTISEKGFRAGFSSSNGTHSFDAQFISSEDRQAIRSTFHEATELISRNNLVLESPEDLEIISSKLQFINATIKARGLHMHTHANTVEMQHEHTRVSAGVHIGVQEKISTTASKVGYVLEKSGTHWLDMLDRALNGYEAAKDVVDIYQDIAQLAEASDMGAALDELKSVQYGVWGSASVTTTSTQNTTARAVDNVISGEKIDINISEDAVIEGIKCDVDEFKLKARSLTLQASHDTMDSQTYSANVSMSVPIKGTVGGSTSVSHTQRQSSATLYHADNAINVSGKLELDIEADGAIRGVKLLADVIDIKARNLVVESLQSTLKERMQGMSVSVGFGLQNGASFGVKPQFQQADKAWTDSIASIVGREVVKVTVQQTLEIVGGLIANADIAADGTLTDKGKADVEAATVIARKLHDYDDGYSYALGVNLSRAVDDKGDVKYGVSVPVAYGFKESSRDILPVIGGGSEVLAKARMVGALSRDVSRHVGATHSESASLDAKLPVSDIVDAMRAGYKAHVASKGVQVPGLSGVSAGDGEVVYDSADGYYILENPKGDGETEQEKADSEVDPKDKKSSVRDAGQVDVDLNAFMGNIAGLSESHALGLNSPFYRQPSQRAESDDAVSHFIGGGSSDGKSSLFTKFKTPAPNSPSDYPDYVRTMPIYQAKDDAFKKYIFNPNPTLGFTPKTLADIGRNLSAEYSLVGAIRAMVDPDASAGAKFKYSPIGFGTAFSGELNEYVLGKIYEHVHKVPLVKGALDLVGAGAGFVTEKVGDAVKSRVKGSWSQSTQDQLSDFWEEMPRGVKFNAELMADGVAIEGAFKAVTSAGKFAKSKIAPTLAADSEVAGGLFKGTEAAAEVESLHGKSHLPFDEHGPTIGRLGDKAANEVLGYTPDVSGGYGDLVAIRLQEACHELYSDVHTKPRVIAKPGNIRDIEYLTSQYGGTANDWIKLSSKKMEFSEGSLVPGREIKIEVHWYENIKTGQRVEAKPKVHNDKWNGQR